MCGRFSQFSPVTELVTQFGVDEQYVDAELVRPRFNVAPTQSALVIASSADGSKRMLGSMRWGLVPRWAKDLSIGNKMINARTDKVATSNAYRSAFAKRRCLVPVDGFYEWAPVPATATSSTTKTKTPFHIHAVDRMPLALAGLWESWDDASGKPLRTFTILTTDANRAMVPIHHRMPVIVDRADWETWLAPSPLEEPDRSRLLTSAPDELLAFDEVTTLVNRPSNDSPAVIEPVR